MVFGAFEKHVLGPRREAIRQARLAEERARLAKERAAEAAEEGAAERAELKAWNERRLQAERSGERFDEPFPIDEEAEGHIEGTGD